ncbi:hypothetical protein FDB55_10660 [Clostridium botulinum]|uniref:Uncharacterized protein n=1 Tax=Clostridium botulinum TaxID=1491 RepID=A0A0C2NQB3_CLOBO|nr:hypothetical protein [Clostridium botulinum]ACD51399.1 conserved hypothetical protein [Clostridium botulinum E3 str. Alaska E43]AJF31180.1 hypothetical protein ST13_10275 [Clostridium botulinum]AJF34239.1 hypothetical protein ST12_10275 [Clostridium botulinum]KAI3350553.1 hypothetical protein CIT18_02520 [Clostridium botulinum]KIL06859.1 hypothetical protein SR42_16105 [Clostridium botulinum]
MRSKGSILIEGIAALFILSLMMMFSMNVYIHNNRVLKERILRENLNRAIYNITNELKYNTKMNELKDRLNEDSLKLSFNEEFFSELISKEILDLTQGDDIKISKIKEDEYKLEILITGFVNKDNIKVDIEESFIKMWWMEYV